MGLAYKADSKLSNPSPPVTLSCMWLAPKKPTACKRGWNTQRQEKLITAWVLVLDLRQHRSSTQDGWTEKYLRVHMDMAS